MSRGGKTADHNLVCCHILTNDEKADKFPCFKANAKEFEIRRRQNYYEIAARTADQREEEEEVVNFLDVAQGLECWKRCKSDNGKVFVGYVKIRVELSNKSNQLVEQYGKFLAELFGTESIFAEDNGMGYQNGYFTSNTGFERIQVACGMKCYDSCLEMSLNCKKDILERQMQFIAPLAIDEFVKINTRAKKDLKDSFSQNGFYPYDFTFTKLRENLERYV